LRKRHNRATLNLCTSVAMVEELHEHGIERLGLWPGGVDTDRFQPSRQSAEMRVRLTDGHPEAPLLLYVGRLSAEKEVERLKPILIANPTARLALVGGGPHRKQLQHQFEGLPVHLAGFLHGDELAQAFASSDIFIMPSRSETLGLVVLEAMSSGLPVVAARAGGIPEMVQHGVNGYLFDDESEAIAAVQQLLASPSLRESIAAAGREHAVQHGWKAATLLLLDHYKAACRQQCIVPNASSNGAHPTLRTRAKSRLRKATIFSIRKLLP